MIPTALSELPDEVLHCEVKRLAGRANTLLAELLAHLAEVETRGVHRERACSSLYVYCVHELRMSEDEAQRRCRAARLARQFPALLAMLAEASVHLTGILLIGPHLTIENQDELLARVRFRTKREIERLVAELAPVPDAPARIEPLHSGRELEERTIDSLTPARTRNTWAAYARALAGSFRELRAGIGAGQAPPCRRPGRARLRSVLARQRGRRQQRRTRAGLSSRLRSLPAQSRRGALSRRPFAAPSGSATTLATLTPMRAASAAANERACSFIMSLRMRAAARLRSTI